MKINYAPIILFAFDRPIHTATVIKELSSNRYASESNLIVYSDFSSEPEQLQRIGVIRKYLKNISGFRSIKIIERAKNFGLSKSVIEGVSEVVEQYGSAIILEDDLVPSAYFLEYMNNALEKYASDESVACIHGYVYPTDEALPEAFFLRGADCWGWGVWKRSWKIFNPDAESLMGQLIKEKGIYEFNFNNSYPYSKMLLNQSKGKNDSWAIRWYASAYLQNMKTLYPGVSLIKNIGMDSTGVNCSSTNLFDVILATRPPDLSSVCPEVSDYAKKQFEKFFRKIKNQKIILRLKYCIDLISLKNSKFFVKKIIPKFIFNFIKKYFFCTIKISKPYSSWSDAALNAVGYDSKTILPKVISATLKVKDGFAAYERDSVLFNDPKYDWNLISFLLDAKNNSNGELIVLDIGGSLGSSFFQNKKFLDLLDSISWNVVEQDHFVEAGNNYIANDMKNLHFYNSLDECILKSKPNFLLLSSVIQYLPDYEIIFRKIKESEINFIYIDRTPFADIENDIFVVQIVPDSIYKASYPMRILSRVRFEHQMEGLWWHQGGGHALDGSFDIHGTGVVFYEWHRYVRNQLNLKVI